MVRLSQRMCWALGAVCLGAGLVLPWAAARVNEVEVVPVVETVRLRPALVRLPGGSFLMGGNVGEDEPTAENLPRRLVALPAFSLCQTEVTQGQYEAVMGVNPSDCSYGCGDELPVQSVSWNDALAYLNKLTALESEALVALGETALTACYEESGADVTWVEGCTGYRLPTEAEWEYAARAGTTTQWSFGDEEAELGEFAWYDGNAENMVHAVGTKRANPWGLYDVHGNVWEWVWDAYDRYKSDRVVNSFGTNRTLRGGPFNLAPGGLRSAHRTGILPESQVENLGFRCARGPGPQR